MGISPSASGGGRWCEGELALKYVYFFRSYVSSRAEGENASLDGRGKGEEREGGEDYPLAHRISLMFPGKFS